MALGTTLDDSAATANSYAKRDGNGDIAFRKLALAAASGGLDNSGYERGGVYSFAVTTTIDNGATINGVMYLCTAGAANRTLNLPAAATWTGQVIEVVKIDSGVGTVILDGNGAETINGATTYTLYEQWESVRVRCDSTGWEIVGRFNPNEPLQQTITDPGNGAAIPVTRSGRCAMTSTGADTRTLAAPTFVGQQILLIHAVDGGSVAVTAASAINIAGNTIMTATAVRAWILLTASLTGVTKVWTVTATDGFTLS